MKRYQVVVVAGAFTISLIMALMALANSPMPQAIMPIISADPSPTPLPSPTATDIPPPNVPPGTEFRGLWVTRFNWASCCKSNPSMIPARLQEIVDNAAYAGFNAIYFQVRGEADAFYRSSHEPWSEMLTGQLGQDPGVDPLGLMIEKAHAKNIQVHAYINTYPVWLGCDLPADQTVPRHFYFTLRDYYGTTDGKPNGLQWNTNREVICNSDYQRGTPASDFVDTHLLNVVKDILNRYAVDGVHLDHIRYASGASCDPISKNNSGADCFANPNYSDWQRAQVNGTVKKIFDMVKNHNSGLRLSAAVWPTYIDYWNWGYSEGYYDYYQDSKAWMGGGYIDTISPMLYSSTDKNPSSGNFRQERWYALVDNFQQSRNGRKVYPGIGTNHYSSFSEIEARIDMARSLGTGGHIIFSYGGLEQLSYFDDLRNGPYSQTALVPSAPLDP